jgi:hypothetical protein
MKSHIKHVRRPMFFKNCRAMEEEGGITFGEAYKA